MQCYVIPFSGQHLVWRPLRRLAFLANSAAVGYLRQRMAGKPAVGDSPVESFLTAVGFWESDPPHPPPWSPSADHRPTTAVLLMTSACNLRCTYCYARGGDRADLCMTLPLARRVIDTAADNAKAAGKDHFSLTFHGGGEPTLNWSVLEGAVRYAKSRGLPCHVGMSSNGVWSESQRQFVAAEFSSLSLSFDGLPQVQNAQRPRADGRGSFEEVMRSMRALDRAHVDYGLRLTATPAAFALLPESVAMLCQESECREMQVEPAFANERGEHSDPTPRQAATFASLFMEAFEVARSYGRLLLYSGARPNLVVSAFCRAAEDALVVTPEGDIVTCYEVHDRRHRLMSRFVIGRATPDAVEIDPDRLRRFAATQNGRRDECAGCFCYWHCAGDCATRCGGAPNDGGGRCEVNRAITRELIAWHIAEGDGVWNGDPLSLDGVPMKLLVRRA